MNSLLAERFTIKLFDFDPDATTATEVGRVDMSNAQRLLVGFFRTIGTSALTFLIQGFAASSGGSATTVKTVTLTGVQPDAVGDQTFVEVTRDEMVAAGEGLRYLTATLTFATATDEAAVLYIREMMTGTASNTANIIA